MFSFSFLTLVQNKKNGIPCNIETYLLLQFYIYLRSILSEGQPAPCQPGWGSEDGLEPCSRKF